MSFRVLYFHSKLWKKADSGYLFCFPFFSADLDGEDHRITCRADYMSPAFLTFLDWVAHKAPFGARSNINAAIPREVYVNFMERSMQRHTKPGAREKLAQGDCPPVEIPSQIMFWPDTFHHVPLAGWKEYLRDVHAAAPLGDGGIGGFDYSDADEPEDDLDNRQGFRDDDFLLETAGSGDPSHSVARESESNLNVTAAAVAEARATAAASRLASGFSATGAAAASRQASGASATGAAPASRQASRAAATAAAGADDRSRGTVT